MRVALPSRARSASLYDTCAHAARSTLDVRRCAAARARAGSARAQPRRVCGPHGRRARGSRPRSTARPTSPCARATTRAWWVRTPRSRRSRTRWSAHHVPARFRRAGAPIVDGALCQLRELRAATASRAGVAAASRARARRAEERALCAPPRVRQIDVPGARRGALELHLARIQAHIADASVRGTVRGALCAPAALAQPRSIRAFARWRRARSRASSARPATVAACALAEEAQLRADVSRAVDERCDDADLERPPDESR